LADWSAAMSEDW
jgi:hypothetical protein